MDMDMELLLSMSHRLTTDMAITLPITLMVTTFTRGLLMLRQDMAMVSTTMARGQLMLDILDMEVMAMDTAMVM